MPSRREVEAVADAIARTTMKCGRKWHRTRSTSMASAAIRALDKARGWRTVKYGKWQPGGRFVHHLSFPFGQEARVQVRSKR